METDSSLKQWEMALGLSLAVGGCFASSSANICIKIDTLQYKDVPYDQHPSLHKRTLVLIGLLFYILLAIFQFSSLAFIPLTISACVCTLNIPINAIMAYYFLGEKMAPIHLAGVMIIMTSAVFAILVGSKDPADRNINELIVLWRAPQWLLFIIILVPLQLFMTITAYRFVMSNHLEHAAKSAVKHSPNVQTVETKDGQIEDINATIMKATALFAVVTSASAQSCWTQLLGKCFTEAVRSAFSDHSPFSHPLTYGFFVCFVLSAIFQLKMVSWMMLCFDAIIAIPIYQSILVLLLMGFGFIFFDEKPDTWLGFFICIVVACVGMLCMARKPEAERRLLDDYQDEIMNPDLDIFNSPHIVNPNLPSSDV